MNTLETRRNANTATCQATALAVRIAQPKNTGMVAVQTNVAGVVQHLLEVAAPTAHLSITRNRSRKLAHKVIAKLHTKVVVHKDLEIEVKTIHGGRPSKLGTLLISRGNIEWLPKGNSVNKKRLSWVRFAELVENHGKTVKVK
jgi:hypothetical protein